MFGLNCMIRCIRRRVYHLCEQTDILLSFVFDLRVCDFEGNGLGFWYMRILLLVFLKCVV